MIKNGYDKIFINPNMVLLPGHKGDVSRYPFFRLSSLLFQNNIYL